MTGISTAYRITIEGLGLQAVTDPAMEQTLADGRVRVRGLLRDGLVIEDESDLARGEIESGGMSLTIVDRPHDHVWTQHLAHRPTVRTWLQGNLAASGAITIVCDSTAGITAGEVIHIGTEAMEVGAIPGAGEIEIDAGDRGYWDTVAQAHYVTDGEALTRPVITLTRPLSIEGRRVFLYRYVLGTDALDGDGTLIWRGVLKTDAKLSAEGTKWTLSADSITALLKQDIGGDIEEPFSARGIFYPASRPFEATIYETGSADWHDDGTIGDSAAISLSGFYETQGDFLDALNTEIDAAVSGWSASYADPPRAVDLGETWGIAYRTGATARWVKFDNRDPTGIDGVIWPRDTADLSALGASTDVTLRCGGSMPGVGGVPRGYYGNDGIGIGSSSADVHTSALAFHPSNLIDLSDGDVVTVQWPGEDDAWDHDVSHSDDTERVYVLRTTYPLLRPYTPASLPKCTARHRLATGSLDTLRDALVATAPADVNRGAAPLLTDDELADWTAVVTRAATSPFQQSRSYVSSQATELSELLAHECRLLGVFPYIDSGGKIALRYLELPTATSLTALTLDDSNILADDGWPSWERGAFGTLNTVTFRTRYDAAEDEHTGPTYTIRDVTALSIRKRSRDLEVAPRSRALGPVPTPREATAAMERMLGVFGRPYSVVKVSLPETVMAQVTVGVVVSLTSPHVPDTVAGSRGVTSAVGLVTARSWDLATGRGDVTLIVSEQPIAGYAPTLRIKAATTLVTGTEYSIPVDFGYPGATSNSMAPSGATTPDFYVVGDEVEMLIWDATTQTPQSGHVTAVVDGIITIEFDSAPTFTGTRYIRFAPAGSVSATSQTAYAFLAGTDSTVGFSSGDEIAREFSA